MATKKITELTAPTTPLAGTELLEMVQSAVSKYVSVNNILELATKAWTYTTIVNTTSGTSLTLTSALPTTALEVEVILNGVSTNTASQPPIIRLGDAGGVETTGYLGVVRTAGSATSVTNGFYLFRAANYVAADLIHGVLRMIRWDPTLFVWKANGFSNSTSSLALGRFSGTKTTSQVTSSITLTTPGGAATFDAGSARVRYR